MERLFLSLNTEKHFKNIGAQAPNGVSTHHQKATDQIKAVFSPSAVVLIMTLATGTVDVLSDHIL